MNNLMRRIWSATFGRALYRILGQRVEALGFQIAATASAQQTELETAVDRLAADLHALNASTLELTELLVAIQRRLEEREGHSERMVAEQSEISSRLARIDRQVGGLDARFSELDRHTRLIVAARWEEAAVNRRLAEIEDRLGEDPPGAAEDGAHCAS